MKIWSALCLELLDVRLPCCFDFFGALAFLYHFADVAATYEQLEERTEEVVVKIEVAVGVDEVFEVYAFGDDFFVRQT